MVSVLIDIRYIFHNGWIKLILRLLIDIELQIDDPFFSSNFE